MIWPHTQWKRVKTLRRLLPKAANKGVPAFITGHRLNGINYLQWSHSIKLHICKSEKNDYVTGAAKRPKKDGSNLKVRNADNNLVMLWFINSMTNGVGRISYYTLCQKISGVLQGKPNQQMRYGSKPIFLYIYQLLATIGYI